jgi:hypothetical protein
MLSPGYWEGVVPMKRHFALIVFLVFIIARVVYQAVTTRHFSWWDVLLLFALSVWVREHVHALVTLRREAKP